MKIMRNFGRKIFPYAVLLAGLAAVAWAVSFSTLPPADFTFHNGDEVKTVDPAKATGQPENRVLNALFEGLLRLMPVGEPDEHGVVPLAPVPAVAERFEVSEDGRVYTFHIRRGAVWSNGRQITADDFVWSWRRTLHPETGSQYAYQLYYIRGAQQYNEAEVNPGDRVEVELSDRPDSLQPFPRGTVRRGVLRAIQRPAEPEFAEGTPQEEQATVLGRWRERWVYIVDVESSADAAAQDNRAGNLQAFGRVVRSEPVVFQGQPLQVQQSEQVLLDFDAKVGVEAVDDLTLVVTLNDRTPFFDELVAFYPLYAVNPECVEEHGTPMWTKPENIISNGPFVLQFRRIRDRIRMVKNPLYWDKRDEQFDVVDVLGVKSNTTALNMYLDGQLDWATDVPKTMIPELLKRDDFITAPALITYFYRLNVDRKPLDNPLVRRALNMAIDKRELVERVTKAGELPARSLVPPGIAGYESALGEDFDPEKARKLLAEAGYPGGRGIPRMEILYNTNDNHRAIAEVISQQWRRHLGIDVELRNLEWGVYLDTTHNKKYTIARAAWVGDYPDPNTFLDMFVTGGEQNQTNWSNPRYDKLIADAGAESDPERRMQLLHEAEQILVEELPIIPLYFYVSINLVKPYVEGFAPNIQDTHPLHILSIDKSHDD